MTFLALSPFEMLTSSLQAGFLAFTVYFSARILETFLRGKSALLGTHWPWTMWHNKNPEPCIRGGDDCTDGEKETFPILTVCLEYPSNLTPMQPTESALHMLQKKVEKDMLFSEAGLNDLIQVLQCSVQVRER